MFKVRFKWTDYDGVQHEEDVYFHINKAELQEMQFTTKGGLVQKISHIMGISPEELTNKVKNGAETTVAADVLPSEDNVEEVYRLFKSFVVQSYGRKKDGYFFKDDQIRKEFECSALFPEIMSKLASDAEFAKSFFTGIFEQPQVLNPAV